MCQGNGVWRSLVARSAGGREVAGSNPVTPTAQGNTGLLILQGFQYFFISKSSSFFEDS